MDNIIETPIIEEVEQSFLDYSLSVITDRAIPSAEDGLKPVARRILYTMLQNGISSNKPYRKCADTVGRCMADYHPHGDSSIYGALVNLAQPWGMRYPLIDFHGNMGSQDGDGPAAYRYTEARLAKIAEATMEDIKKNSVNFQTNYSETDTEPVNLPGIFPNLLCNGTTGIAVAMATTFLPHNLTEVMSAIINAIEEDNYSVENALRFITGPDFPNGGIITNGAELHKIYETGKGRVKIRGEYTIDKNKIIFTSVPYKVSKEKLTLDIDNLCEEGKLKGISLVRDESTKDGVRFVVETEKSANPLEVVNSLFSCTDLETTVNANQVALEGKTPKLMNLSDIIKIYVQHQKEVLGRVTKYDYQKVSAQLEVQQGLLKALEDIDNIIKLIKASNDSKDASAKLIEKYSFTEAQAKAILDMKLSKLSHLEKVEIENNIKELAQKASSLLAILSNETEFKKALVKKLEDFKNKFGDERRTKITNIEVPKTKEEKVLQSVVPQEVVVTISEKGNINRVPKTKFRPQKRNGKGVKLADEITNIVSSNTTDIIYLFSNRGRMYRILANSIPESATPISTLVKMQDNEKIILASAANKDEYLLFVTAKGMVKRVKISDFGTSTRAGGVNATKLKEDDSLVAVDFINEEDVILFSETHATRIAARDIPIQGKTALGVKGMTIDKDEHIISVVSCNNIKYIAMVDNTGAGKKVNINEFSTQSRGGKGLMICPKDNKIVGAVGFKDDKDLLVISSLTNSICVEASEFPELQRMALGNQIIRDTPISIVKL